MHGPLNVKFLFHTRPILNMQFPYTLLYEMEFKPCYHFTFYVISTRLLIASPLHWTVD